MDIFRLEKEHLTKERTKPRVLGNSSREDGVSVVIPFNPGMIHDGGLLETMLHVTR